MDSSCQPCPLGDATWLNRVAAFSRALLPLFTVSCLQVMPVETVGFMMKPYGFFTWNPTLDVPPERNEASREELTPAARSGAAGMRARL